MPVPRVDTISSSPDDGLSSVVPSTQPHHACGFMSALPSKREVVRQFTPSWFTVTMGTGSVAITINAFPFNFTGKSDIAWAVWWLTAVLFVLFSCLMLGRVLFFSSTIRHLFAHPNQSLFMGAIPMSVGTLTNGVVALFLPRFGVVAAHVAHAMFWINLPAVLLCIVLVPLSMFTVHDHGLHSMTAVWLLPVVPACVAANTAGVVAAAIPEAHDGINVTALGLALLGIGFLLSYQICTIYYNRLSCHKLPAREVIISSFLPVGPMAMTAWALLNLAAAAQRHILSYLRTKPDFSSSINDPWLEHIPSMSVVVAAIIAVMLWGYATWWLLLAVTCISETLRQGIPFNLGWWGSVFPMGVWAGMTCQLARTMHNTGFTYMGAIAVCCHVLLWLVVVTLTALRAWTGHLFHAPCLAKASVTNNDSNDNGKSLAVAADIARAASELEDKLQLVTLGSNHSLHDTSRHSNGQRSCNGV